MHNFIVTAQTRFIRANIMPLRRLMLRDSTRRIVLDIARFIFARTCRETSNYCYSHFVLHRLIPRFTIVSIPQN